ncbi:putative GTP-binding protein OBGM, mitochondrial [Ananas comosus]|uniref:Putative GTP-binding protein OBGM, mitochondrial n=1 Tax=Ananas comosus TaxID=4615 RepID=A0A199W5K6_ANACO|nr:putative GTP-binding protein OBGM, mitochondrial [Ananas comosus]
MWLRCVVLRHGRILPLPPSPNPSWFVSSFSYSNAPSKKGKAAPLQVEMAVEEVMLFSNARRLFGISVTCNTIWLNAKRGGHGVSKNQIGTRGSDKVVQVPVGTVMHLVEGELPSFVENNSVRSADPWDIPDNSEDFRAKPVQNNANAFKHSMVKEDRRASTSYSCNNGSKEIVGKGNLKPRISPFSEKAFPSIEDGVSHDHSYGTEPENEEEDHSEDDFDYDDGEEEEEEEEEEEVQYAVAELTEPGQRLIIARGGEGGLGNACLRKDHKSRKKIKDNSSNLAYIDDEDESLLHTGKPGSESVLILELKSIADVGLVGMPNAGKSTLLGALSRAQPVVGHYAFTTLRPNIGNLNYEDFFSVKVADIPGLIKGAHQNRGLGHAFLRHIERTKVLAYVVDLAAALNGRKGISPWEQLRDLVLELEYHQEGLSSRPSLIVANKIDEDGAEKVCEELQRRVRDVPIFPVCAILQEGVPELKTGLRRLIDGNEARSLDLSKIIVD